MKNICAPSHKNHTFAVKILHRNFILTFYHLSFFGSQFQRRSTTGWVIVMHIYKLPLERYLHSLYEKSPDTDPSESTEDNKTISGPVLPWALTMKHIEPQCIQDTAAIILSVILMLKTPPKPPFTGSLSPLQSIWNILPLPWEPVFHPLVCTCVSTQLSRSSFAEASWVVSLSPLLKGSCDHRWFPDLFCKAVFVILQVSPSMRFAFPRSPLRHLRAFLCSSKQTDITE